MNLLVKHPTLLGLAALLVLPLCAANKNYGYIIGKPVAYSTENSDNMGKYLHYKVTVQVDPANPNAKRTAVVNIREFTDQRPVLYKAHSVNWLGINYQSIFSRTDGVYPLTHSTNGGVESEGALDFIRHQGILKDGAGTDWKQALITSSGSGSTIKYSTPEWDELFKNARRCYIFGELFTDNGGGVHRVHQNQGDTYSSFKPSNAPWQDGAIILEYDPISLQMPGHWILINGVLKYFPGTTLKLPNRKILYKYMGQGSNGNQGQAQFTYTNANGTSKAGDPIPAGNILHPVNKVCSLLANQTQDFGPFTAEQLEVKVVPQSGDADVFIKKGAPVSSSSYDTSSANTGNKSEYVRCFGQGQYYIQIKAKGGPANVLVQVNHN